MPFITFAQLQTLLNESRLSGPELLETKQSFEADGGTTVEEALVALEASIPEPQEVASDANVATVVVALKALGLFVEPA